MNRSKILRWQDPFRHLGENFTKRLPSMLIFSCVGFMVASALHGSDDQMANPSEKSPEPVLYSKDPYRQLSSSQLLLVIDKLIENDSLQEARRLYQ